MAHTYNHRLDLLDNEGGALCEIVIRRATKTTPTVRCGAVAVALHTFRWKTARGDLHRSTRCCALHTRRIADAFRITPTAAPDSDWNRLTVTWITPEGEKQP